MVDLEARLGKVEQDLLDTLAALAHNHIELIQAENEIGAAEIGSKKERLANWKHDRLLLEHKRLQSEENDLYRLQRTLLSPGTAIGILDLEAEHGKVTEELLDTAARLAQLDNDLKLVNEQWKAAEPGSRAEQYCNFERERLQHALKGLRSRQHDLRHLQRTLLATAIRKPLGLQSRGKQGLNLRREIRSAFHEAMEESKNEPISISSIQAETWRSILLNAGLTRSCVTTIQGLGREKQVEAFGWEDRPERAQADRYMVHLPQIVSLDTRQYEWVDAANHFPTLLSYDGSALGRKLTGTTDVVVVSRGTVKGHQKEVGLVLLFELRKKVDAASVAQAQLGLLLANIHSPELRPVMVLTDLRDEWHFIWVDYKAIRQYTFDMRGLAVGYIEDFSAGRIKDEDDPGVATVPRGRNVTETLLALGGPPDQLHRAGREPGGLSAQKLKAERGLHVLHLLMEHSAAPFSRPIPEGFHG